MANDLSTFVRSLDLVGLDDVRQMSQFNLSMLKEIRMRQAQEQKQQLDDVKWTLGKLIDSYNHSNTSTSMKHILRAQMANLYSSIPEGFREVLTPYILNSPISPEEEKAARFDEMYPPPPIPYLEQEIQETNEDGVRKFSSVPKVPDPYAFASKFFARKDWEAQRAKVVFGHAPDEPKNFVKLPQGGAVLRGKDGNLTYLSDAELMGKEVAEKYGVTMAELFANGGYISSNKTLSLIQNGEVLKVRNAFNALDPSQPIRQEIVERSPAPNVEYSTALNTFLQDFYSKNKKNPFAKRINDLADAKGYAQATRELQSTFPEYTFEFVPQAKVPSWARRFIPFLSDTEMVLLPHIGRPKQVGFDANGNPLIYYVDHTGTVRNAFNQILGNFGEVSAQIAQNPPKPLAPPPEEKKEKTEKGFEIAPPRTVSPKPVPEKLPEFSETFGQLNMENLRLLADITGFSYEEFAKKPLLEILNLFEQEKNKLKKALEK